MTMSLTELNSALLVAHDDAVNDPSKVFALVDLYFEVYVLTLKKDTTAAFFYLTNAYVYALDTDHVKCDEIENLLYKAGRL